MILHIFRKDVGVLWPFAVGAILTDLADALLHLGIESVQYRGDLEALNLFVWAGDLIAYLFGFSVIVMAVQLDPIPGKSQDWLARPVQRRDLLLAKLLFVILFVQAPLFLADTVHGVAAGFPLGQTLAAAGMRNLYLLFLITLPVMALAAMTPSIKQTLALGLAAAVGGLAVAGGILGLYGLFKVTADNGHTTTSFVLQMAVLAAGAAAIIALQYFRRATNFSRVILALAAFLALGARLLLPQNAAYAMENRFSRGEEIFLSFAPEAGKLRAVGSETNVAGSASPDSGRLIAIPLMVAGLAPQLALIGAEMRAVLTAPDGNAVELRAVDFPLQTPDHNGKFFYQMLRVPSDFFGAYAGQPIRLDLYYQLVVADKPNTYEIAAIGGELRDPQLGHCAASMNPKPRGIILRCMQVGEEHVRVRAALTDPVTGLSNPEAAFYWPSDAPYRNGDAIITRFGHGLPFLIPDVAAQYPVGPAQISRAKLRLDVFQPRQWIVRHVTIGQIRLNAWTSDIGGSP